MKSSAQFLTICAFLLFVSCNDEISEANLNVEKLVDGLINFDQSAVSTEINKLTTDLKPVNQDHQNNIERLIHRINKQDENFKATLVCYACIKTLPPQSEIVLTIDSLGNRVLRTIDIATPSNDKLKCVGIHE